MTVRIRLLLLAAVAASALVLATPATADHLPEQPSLPRFMAAVGDSITSGWGASTDFEEKDVSWSTGGDADVNSHVKRLRALGAPVRVWNLAKVGTRAKQLGLQASTVPVGTKYVSITTGSTEVCSTHTNDLTKLNNQTATVEAGLRNALSVLVQRNPEVRILVLSVPNWYDLWLEFNGNPAVSDLWKTSNTNICPLLLQEPPADATTRAEVDKAIKKVNLAVAAACGEFFPNCLSDGKAVYDYGFGTGGFEANDLGFDGFHLNDAGQNKLAQLGWDAGWYVHGAAGVDRPDLRILLERLRAVRGGRRLVVQFDTIPGATYSVIVRNAAGRRIARASGGTDSLGQVVKRIKLPAWRRFVRVQIKTAWAGQTAKVSRRVR